MIDERIRCLDCRELARGGRCLVAVREERLDVSKYYGPPLPDVPWRCEHFQPKADDEDQRSGRERFPLFWAEYEARYGQRGEIVTRGLARAKAVIEVRGLAPIDSG